LPKKKQPLCWYHRESLERLGAMSWFRFWRRFRSACNWVWAAPGEFSIPWKFIKFILLTIPSIGLVYVTTQIGSNSYPLQGEVTAVIQKYPWTPFLLIFGPAIIGFLFDIFECHCAKKLTRTELDQDEFYVILRAIEQVVGRKRNAITPIVTQTLTGRRSRGEVFTDLAKPREQIGEIISQLYLCIREITRDSTLKVGLVATKSGLPLSDGAIFQPLTSSPSQAMFEPANAQQTLFYQVASQCKTIVINDLEAFYRKTKGGKRIYLYVNDQIDVGSIQCMPVIEPIGSKVVYAISLLSDTPDLFSEKNQKKIQTITDYFIARIVMEYLIGMLLANTLPDENTTNSGSSRDTR